MEVKILNWTEQIIPWLLKHGIRIVIILIVAYLLNIILRRLISRAIRVAVIADETMSKEGEKRREDTLIHISEGAIRVSLIIIAFLMILQETGLEIGPILAGAGIVGLAVGFGAQYLIRDIITGLFIILENQYRIGDVIKIEEAEGTVEYITLRMTTLRDLNGTVHHIPHGEIKRVSNLSKKFARINLNIGISYSANLEHVIKVINQTGDELAKDPRFTDSIITAPKFLRVNEFTESAIIIKIMGDTKPLMQWEITGELRKQLKIAFDREGIEFPFPQMVIHNAKE